MGICYIFKFKNHNWNFFSTIVHIQIIFLINYGCSRKFITVTIAPFLTPPSPPSQHLPAHPNAAFLHEAQNKKSNKTGTRSLLLFPSVE